MLHSKNSLLEKRRRINFIIRSAHWKFEIRALLILRDEIIRMNDALIIQILFESSLNMKSTILNAIFFSRAASSMIQMSVYLYPIPKVSDQPNKTSRLFGVGLCVCITIEDVRGKKKRKLGLERTIYLCPNPSLRDQTELRTLICDRKKL